MDLEDLRALLSVVEHGSFQAAALARGEPRTRLRRQIDALEAEVGLPLIHRDVRGVTLTVAGERVAARAGALLREADALLESARQRDEGAVGTVRLIAPVGMPVVQRAGAAAALLRRHPGLALDVTEVDDPLSCLNQPFDYLVHFGERPRLTPSFSRVLMRISVGLMASPAWLEEVGAPRTVEDLRRHPLLAWRPQAHLAAAWPRLHDGPVAVAPRLTSANPIVVAEVARSGGIALLPRAAELFYPDAGLVPVLPNLFGGELTLRLLSHHHSRTEPRLRAFFDNIEQLMAAVEPILV